MSRPSSSTLPEVSVSMPPRMLSSVVLPAPDAPTMTQISPFSISKVMSRRASMVTSPMRYCFLTLRNST